MTASFSLDEIGFVKLKSGNLSLVYIISFVFFARKVYYVQDVGQAQFSLCFQRMAAPLVCDGENAAIKFPAVIAVKHDTTFKKFVQSS